MKRWGVVLCIGILGFLMGTGDAAQAQTSKPYISDFDAAYHLGRDSEKRSTLKVTEQITVEFPLMKNKGIVREIPREYDGHSVHIQLQSVTRNGETEPLYSQRNEGKFLILETGTDEYVSGTQVFEITYSLRDVTRFFADENSDEFYWDVNGTGWRSSIEALSARLTIDEDLRAALTGNTACYQGRYGSDQRCDVQQDDGGFVATAMGLAAGENVTMAVGFVPGTFAAYQPSLWERLLVLWVGLLVVTGVIGTALLVWASIRAYRWTYRDGDIGTVVPEYIPPKNASVAVAAAVSPGHYATLAAQLTDLAVRHYIQILETREKSLWRTAEYDIKVIRDVADLRSEEREILKDMFGHTPEVGERLALKTMRNNTGVYTRFSDNDKKIANLIKGEYKLKQPDEDKSRWLRKLATALLVGGIVTLNPYLLVLWGIIFALSKTFLTLSDEGLALRRYLKGLELYIKVAEKDRLAMLQSPEGAEKVALKDSSDPAQLVKLYERVLPYAILFHQEKEWSKQIGDYYENAGTQPSWYSGNTAFNAAVFSSMMTNFSSSVSTTSASSSSSGGSGGGGFSGGGGGGGGGGFR